MTTTATTTMNRIMKIKRKIMRKIIKMAAGFKQAAAKVASLSSRGGLKEGEG
jgi:hypothetical protein